MKKQSKASAKKKQVTLRKKSTKVVRNGKTKFIGDHIVAGKLTAREIAKLVVKKYPEKDMTPEAQMDKALRFVRAVPWHLKQKGIEASYKSAYAKDEPKTKTSKAKVASEDVAEKVAA